MLPAREVDRKMTLLNAEQKFILGELSNKVKKTLTSIHRKIKITKNPKAFWLHFIGAIMIWDCQALIGKNIVIQKTMRPFVELSISSTVLLKSF